MADFLAAAAAIFLKAVLMTQSAPPSTQGLTRSEILPFRSKNISLVHSRAMLPLALTVVAFFFFTLSPFNTRSDIDRFIDGLGCFLAMIIFIEIYYYAAVPKSMWAYTLAALFVAAQLVIFAQPWFLIFHQFLGGEPTLITSSTSAVEVFRIYFVGPGCMEETMKACPALIGLWLARRAAKHPDRPQGRLKRALTLNGPMDGVITGVAAAIGFLLIETLGQYVPDTIAKQLNDGAGLGTAGLIGVDTLIARILNVVMGHAAWAGITGYFIGLAVRHREAQIRLVIGSLLLAAFLHAGWDSSIQLNAVLPLLAFGVVSPLLFLSCLVKAHQMQVVEHAPAAIDRSVLLPRSAIGGSPAPARPPAVGVPGSDHPSRLARLVTVLEHAIDVHGKVHPPAASPAMTLSPHQLVQGGAVPPPAAPSPLAPTSERAADPPALPSVPSTPVEAAAVRAEAQPTPSPVQPPATAGPSFDKGAIRLVFIVDASASMAGERMAAVAYAVRSLLPMLSRAADDHPEVALSIEVVRFGDEAVWITPSAVSLHDYAWSDVPIGGGSNLGAALTLIAQRLRADADDRMQFVLVLLSDGLPTDDLAAGFGALLGTPAGAKALRIGVAVGDEVDSDFLDAFAGRLDQPPLTPETLGDLVARMPWPSVPSTPVSRPIAAAETPAGMVW